ncbi:MAG TPA: hypothetical protein PKW33_07395 [Anaerolineaceae bacterium]|nr:hypothetical protein [Anaerolineaceae bacterium]HPN51396.1 hypothetical protein [Anaerolineaceae bacterium]
MGNDAERNRRRRIGGLVLGAALAIIFGLLSGLINPLHLPGVPFYQPPFGVWGNLVLWLAMGLLVGLASTWSESGGKGLALGCLTGVLVVSLYQLWVMLQTPYLISTKIVAIIAIALPLAGALLPLILLFRSAIDRLYEDRDRPFWWPAKIWKIVVMLAAAVVIGLAFQYSPAALRMVQRMDDMLKTAQQATSAEALPAPLRGARVVDFMQHGMGAYELSWDRDEYNRYAIPRLSGHESTQAVVVVNFKNGWVLACLFPDPEGTPECRSFQNE